MDHSKTLEKLQMLIDLCEVTQTEDDVTNTKLFDQHKIDAYGMMNTVRDLHTGKKVVDADTEREVLIATMKSANKIWRIRNKIKSGEYSSVNHLDDKIRDYLTQGIKITAIKYYRSETGKATGTTPSLKESKDYVDDIHDDILRRKGLV